MYIIKPVHLKGMSPNYKAYYTLEEAVQRVYFFHELLAKHGIKVDESSDLYRISYNVLEFLEKHKYPELRDNATDIRNFMREVLGFNDFIAKICSVANHPNFDQLLPHLHLMNASSIPLTTKALVTDDGSNKLFELYMAVLCMHCFDYVALESPGGQKGKIKERNPDVMFTFNGKKWAIACKVLHSDKVETIINNYEKGIDQIEKSPAETGIVILNLKNIVDYNKILPLLNEEQFKKGKEPIFGSYPDIRTPAKTLYDYGTKIRDDIFRVFGGEEFQKMYKGKKSVPGFLLFCQAATSVFGGNLPALLRNNTPTPSIVRLLNLVQSPDELTEDVISAMTCLNNVMQSIQ